MATRRKVSNLLGLAVLSVVVQRPMHPYEMASILRARGKDRDMDLKWGSLYTVVQNLAKHGFIEAIGNARSGARPERTVYRIADAGREELVDWTRELVSTAEREHPRFEAGLSMLGILGPNATIELLEQRLAQLDRDIEVERQRLESSRNEIPRVFLLESEYMLALRRAEAEWVRELLGELQRGEFPDVEPWQAFAETGEQPAAFAALAERGSTDE